MKKAKNFIKGNINVLLAFIIGFIITSGGVYAAIVIQGTEVTYSNANLSATNVQKAIDEIYQLANSGGGGVDLRTTGNYVEAYTYNESTCVTGNESTCVATTCYKTKSANACPAGTIIKYQVRPGEVETFHVMYDDASTITMQAQRNTVYTMEWITALEYSGSTSYGNDKGPLTILKALESATAGWEYVNDITYTAGTTTFKTNAYTGCSSYSSCATNTYTLASRTAKARMITEQEAALLGCITADKSCPNWMNNYLASSTSYGGTVNDTSVGTNGSSNNGYWTMSVDSSDAGSAWFVHQCGAVYGTDVSYARRGARAVVVVSK